jgi:microcystin-dependent protein
VSDYVSTAATGTLAPAAIASSGGNQPHSNIQPFLCINFIIALNGIFPSRN